MLNLIKDKKLFKKTLTSFFNFKPYMNDIFFDDSNNLFGVTIKKLKIKEII